MPVDQMNGVHTSLADLPLAMPFDSVKHYGTASRTSTKLPRPGPNYRCPPRRHEVRSRDDCSSICPQASTKVTGEFIALRCLPPHIYKIAAPTARRICAQRCKKTFSVNRVTTVRR